MVIVNRKGFSVSEYAVRKDKRRAELLGAKGPIIDIHVRFELWRPAERFPAQVFVDPGADCTFFSWRWFAEVTGCALPGKHPMLGPRWTIVDDVRLEIGNRILNAPVSAFRKQGDEPKWLNSLDPSDPACGLPPLPGYEDGLLGRDFLLHHRSLFLIDGRGSNFSVLIPDDVNNEAHYNAVIGALPMGDSTDSR